MDGLFRRGGIWSARLVVPPRLRGRAGRREFIQSTVNRLQQLFMLALSQGKKLPAEWAQITLQVLTAERQKLVKEGKTLETPEENLAELNLQATAFSTKQLPIMRAL
jgi:hypothetical protein